MVATNPYWTLVQAKEQWNAKLEGIVPYILGDGVQPISEWVKLVRVSNKELLLQM